MMKLWVSFLMVCIVALSGCSSGGNQGELDTYIEKVKARPAGTVEPLPTFTPYESFVYSAAAGRSPFDRPVDLTRRVYGRSGTDVKPDLNRELEYLEGFGLEDLQMVGTLERGGTLWALIEDPSGFVTTVTKGNYIGKNHGRIVDAADLQIELLEIVSNGLGGWVERPRILAIAEKD